MDLPKPESEDIGNCGVGLCVVRQQLGTMETYDI
jgi:hypothetical protein